MSQSSLDHLDAPRRQWWWVLTLFVLTLICGSIGLWQYEKDHHPEHAHGLGPLYHAVQMTFLHTPHFQHGVNGWIEAGRWLGVATFASGAAALFWKRLRREWNLLRLRGWKDHLVICGLGAKGFEVARCHRKNPLSRIVVIDPQPSRHHAEWCDEQGVCLLAADGADKAILQLSGAARARSIVVITPSDETNVRIAAELRRVCESRTTTPALCYIHLGDINLRESLQRSAVGSGASAGGCRLHFFDVFDHEARRLIGECPLDGDGIRSESGDRVHVVILGFSRMGRSIALRAAKIGQFANHQPLRISVIDRAANLQRERFLFRNPAFADSKICQLEFHQMEAESYEARRRVERWAAEPGVLLHVYVSLDTDAHNLEVVMRLREGLAGCNEARLYVRFHSRQSVAPIIELPTPGGIPIETFGMIEDACCDEVYEDPKADDVAKFIHERFVARRGATSARAPGSEPTLLKWNELAEDIRESNRQQADHIGVKLRAIDCELVSLDDRRGAVTKFPVMEEEILAEMEHRRWNAERRLAGWEYGTPKDVVRRRNPNIDEWGNLDKSIQEYDRETVRDLPQLAALLQPPKKIVRRNGK